MTFSVCAQLVLISDPHLVAEVLEHPAMTKTHRCDTMWPIQPADLDQSKPLFKVLSFGTKNSARIKDGGKEKDASIKIPAIQGNIGL